MKFFSIIVLLIGVSSIYADVEDEIKWEKKTASPEDAHTDDENFREGDMKQSGGGDGEDRNMISGKRYRWPKKGGFVIVPYIFQGVQTPGAKKQVAAAIKDYARWTCVKFVPRKTQKDYLSIYDAKNGCWSLMGKQGGKQSLSLTHGCAYDKGTPTHEFMHALGFNHEQSREDRNKFVRLVEKNMARGLHIKAQFAICKPPKCTLPKAKYDYDSVMHYQNTAFSGNGKPTLVAKQAGAKFGQRAGLSKGDIKKVKEMYNCKKTVKPNSGHIIPSKEPQDLANNCPSYKSQCKKRKDVKAQCPRTCSGKY